MDVRRWIQEAEQADGDSQDKGRADKNRPFGSVGVLNPLGGNQDDRECGHAGAPGAHQQQARLLAAEVVADPAEAVQPMGQDAQLLVQADLLAGGG